MKKNLGNPTMNELLIQKIYDYPIYPTESNIYSDKGFVKTDNGSMGGTHRTCYIVEGNKSYYYDSFGGQPDNFPLNQLPKPLIYQNNKIQDINYVDHIACTFFYLIERMV